MEIRGRRFSSRYADRWTGAAGPSTRRDQIGALKMEHARLPLTSNLPVAIVGAGPVGLTAALALSYYGIPFVVFEADAGLSTETKAGTTLTRTLEIWQRFGAASTVLTRAVRVDEIG